jgi:hypothetical protein
MIQKKDLADLVLDKQREGEFLYCPACGGEYSASSGDYWNLPDDYNLFCGSWTCAGKYNCLILARHNNRIEVIKQ